MSFSLSLMDWLYEVSRCRSSSQHLYLGIGYTLDLSDRLQATIKSSEVTSGGPNLTYPSSTLVTNTSPVDSYLVSYLLSLNVPPPPPPTYRYSSRSERSRRDRNIHVCPSTLSELAPTPFVASESTERQAKWSFSNPMLSDTDAAPCVSSADAMAEESHVLLGYKAGSRDVM